MTNFVTGGNITGRRVQPTAKRAVRMFYFTGLLIMITGSIIFNITNNMVPCLIGLLIGSCLTFGSMAIRAILR